MTAGGLPYEECRRAQREHTRPGGRTDQWPAYALPPFHPGAYGGREARGTAVARPAPRRGPRPVRRSGRRRDGAAMSGMLIALCVGALLAAVVLAGARGRC
ncbi:hypothetical protein GCM10010521_64850 [Streptomyces rameus]|uniref:Uncharacterized protein n=1 Tax=Streptomyces rameus TaxID=68261 RepID=A0ABN3V3P3_9ACTN